MVWTCFICIVSDFYVIIRSIGIYCSQHVCPSVRPFVRRKAGSIDTWRNVRPTDLKLDRKVGDDKDKKHIDIEHTTLVRLITGTRGEVFKLIRKVCHVV